MIRIDIIGHLGKDATVNQVNGRTVINFSVAHTEKWKDQSGNEQQKTIWAECGYWTDKTAIAPYLTKGTQVFVTGKPEARAWTTNDGKAGASLNITVGQVQLLGGGQSQQQATSQPEAAPATAAQPAAHAPADKLPF